MGQGNVVGAGEAAAVFSAVARLEARGVNRRAAMRRVARNQGWTVRYVRSVAARDRMDWGL
jgi:hypothetical protein